VQGGSGCEPDPDGPFVPAAGRWAAVAGARRILERPGALLRDAAAAGARVLVVADREGARGLRAAAALAGRGVRLVPLDGADPVRAEAAVREAAAAIGEPVALVALPRCAREEPRRAPLAVEGARCNRCGACLSLGCPAISDLGGEALAIDGAVCAGCGACAPLCRARAIRPR
jgi:TPP-dependent indolepyruvate ferredoxin oxidoreductase alpha subunit